MVSQELRYEVEPTQYVLRIYDASSDTNYIASALIRTHGDRGWMSSISSPRLFDALPRHFDGLLTELGLKTLEGYMSKAMARAVRIRARMWADYKVLHSGVCAGREMFWVVLSRRS